MWYCWSAQGEISLALSPPCALCFSWRGSGSCMSPLPRSVCPDCLGQSSCAASTPVWEEGCRAWPAPLLILMWPQPLTAPGLPREGFSVAGLGMGPKPLPLGAVTACLPGAKVAAGHPRLSQALGSPGTVPGPPGQRGGSWLVLSPPGSPQAGWAWPSLWLLGFAHHHLCIRSWDRVPGCWLLPSYLSSTSR